MTLYLSSEDVLALCNESVALEAAHSVLAAQREGNFALPGRMDLDTSNGFFRVMPAAVGDYAGMKVMTLARGVGNRYLLALYSQESGELIALIDADEVTRLRTAASTVLASELLCSEPVTALGLIGTGFEATGHLRAFAHRWNLMEVSVYSPSEERRARFAGRMSEELGIPVRAVGSAAEALAVSPVSLLCTKSPNPVVKARDIAGAGVVLSIGSTRPDLRELDVDVFERSAAVLVDDAAQVIAESADVSTALERGAIEREQIIPVHEWNPSSFPVSSERNLVTYKSVGTALQDLILAAKLVSGAKEQGLGRELGELASLKTTVPVAVKA